MPKKEPTGWKSFKNMDEALKFMKERDMAQNDEEKAPKKVTDIDAVEDNVEKAVMAFNERWMPWPRFDIGVEVMDVRRDGAACQHRLGRSVAVGREAAA